MSQEVQKDWNKTRDTATYIVNRAESKLEEAKTAVLNSYEQSQLKQTVDDVIEPFWRRNKDNIILGSAVGLGSLIVLLSIRV